MQRFLISVHLHLLALILGVIFVPLLISGVRKWIMKKAPHDAETNNKLRLDIATVIPVGVLLWNLIVFYVSNIAPSAQAEEAGHALASAPVLTFEQCVAAAGESTVALATAIIFARLFGSIWRDAWRD